jgi:hypothetical protein
LRNRDWRGRYTIVWRADNWGYYRYGNGHQLIVGGCGWDCYSVGTGQMGVLTLLSARVLY